MSGGSKPSGPAAAAAPHPPGGFRQQEGFFYPLQVVKQVTDCPV